MVKMIKTKKGVSGHVEIIISFVIFIAFVTFLLIFANPIKKTNTSTHYLEITEDAIMERILTNLTTFSVILPSPSTGCFCVNYDRPGDNARLIVRDEVGGTLGARSYATTPGQICISGTKRFHKIYFSEEFEEQGAPVCSVGLLEGSYTVGVLNEYKIVSNKSLYNLNISYSNDYGNLRSELGIPGDFNIFVSNPVDGEYLVYGKIQEPRNSEIMAKEILIEVINEDGEVIPALMSLQVW